MKSKGTLSRERKINMLLDIHQKTMRLLLTKREYLSFINSWELKDINQKLNSWIEKIFST